MKVSNHPLYHTWNGMVRRCRDPENYSYPYYGAKGIDCLDEWAVKGEWGTRETPSGFLSFLSYVEEHLGERPDGFSLDRIENTIGYYPGNIRWSNHSTQNYNRSLSPTRAIRIKPSGKYQVCIRHNKQSLYLGSYDTLDEAIQVRDHKYTELGVT